MRHLHPWLSILFVAILLDGCGGNAANPRLPAAPGAATAPFLGLRHTPARPPARSHRITAGDRARARAGGWQQVAGAPPFTNGAGMEMLMTDGTVLMQDDCTSNWYGLTPDANGNYASGTWTKKASMPANYAPLYYASAVLPDGRLIVNGGEYNFCKSAETNLGAIYDPVANTWAPVLGPTGWGEIGDAQSIVLSDGTYMLGNCCTSVQALFNESTMTWTQIGTGKQDPNSEEGWTLLRDGSVLAVNVSATPFAQVYVPKTNAWSAAGQLPVNVIAGAEIGPQTLRPNNSVFVAGANGNTVTYRPGSGSWVLGPKFPIVGGKQLDVADGPSTVLTNATVMIAASPGLYHAPATFFVFDGKKLATIAAPPNAVNDSSYNLRLLMLPTGQVLAVDGSNDIEIYTSGKKSTIAGPEIATAPSSLSRGSTYTITGKRFNGMSQTNMYGDDAQNATNYPLVRIANNATGHTFYARTHGFSFMGVGSNRQVSTSVDVPSSTETGASMLVVVANGIASQPVAVTIL